MSDRATLYCAIIAGVGATVATFMAIITFFQVAAEHRWFQQ